MGRIKRDVQVLVKNRLDEIYKHDYIAKNEKLKSVTIELVKNPNAKLDDLITGLKIPEKKAEKVDEDLSKRAEAIFRESIFTMRGPEESIYSAALVKMKGKMVVLATKEFIPRRFPVVFANSRGKVVCSKAYVSETHPMVLFIPDYEPKEFNPIEVVEPEDVSNLFDRELFMIAPHEGGFLTVPLLVFSEDKDYLNLSSYTNPSTSYSTSLRRLDRDGNKLLVSITQKMSVGENSVVIDSKTGKLVSMAVRIFNPGVLSWRGKTGSVIGHENFAIPDVSTFIRQFNGTANKTDAPRGAIRFVRMTAFENWKPLNVSKFWSQKNEIREFTDSNNDFLMFFMHNSFHEALRSNRIARVAEKYRKPLLYDNLTRTSWENQYRTYMLEVSYLLKRELMGNKKVEDYYSIYREEYKYQLALRQAMYDYLSAGLKDSNIVNLIHVDLTTRHGSSHSTGCAGGRIGGSIGGGY